MSDGPMIRFDTVTKDFEGVRAVDHVSIDIQRGEFFSLLGPSGCGKTTLLRMLAGFELPTAGSIYLDDEDTSSVPPHKRPVNIVFQNYAIFPHLDVFQNISYGMRKSGLSKSELADRVQDMLQLIKLPGYGTRRADQLSGGERQRVALARALIKQPKVLLLDEPLGALDKKLREDMQVELRELQKTVGITFVFVTHDQEEALSMSDRVAVMSRGQALQIDAPRTVYRTPNTQFVADFIGTMNFIEVHIAAVSNERLDLDAGNVGRFLVRGAAGAWREGSPATLAVRPERIVLRRQPPSDEENAVFGQLGPMAYMGDRSRLHVHVDGWHEPLIVAGHALEEIVGDLESGDGIWATWPGDAAVLLER